jgi:hypothetical protein
MGDRAFTKTDALSRRLRFAPPNPKVRRLVLTEPDYFLFEAIGRHGPLSSHYLYEFTRHLRRNETHLKNRLTEFYNGDSQGALLVRPPQQFAGYEARYQHIVYDLAPRAKVALAERGTITRFSPRRADAFLHQLMQACVAASLELTAPAKGLRYIPRNEILSSPKCPADTKRAKNPMAVPVSGIEARSLIPDDLFGIEYPGVGFRFFAIEIDRNTESIERKSAEYNTFAKKIGGYLDILRSQSFRSHWGLPNLSVLTVTTNAAHARNIIEYVARLQDPTYAGRFAFACEPSFGINWRVPREVLSNLLNEPWMTISGPKDISAP